MRFSKYIIALVLLAFSLNAYAQKEEDTTTVQKKPNVVLILVDDSGLMDFGAFGGEARTPKLL